MSYLEAILYGAVQGIAEFLPISSSAHLVILPHFLDQKDPGLAFDVFLHLGTLLAILIYFRRDWFGVFSGKGEITWKPIAIATVPALIAGGLLHTYIETVFRGLHVVATTLILGGIVLFLADRFCQQKRSLDGLSGKDALWVGIAQCFALVPGVSRSGSTMIGARLLGFNRETAARFSFLISAPVTGAAVVYELRNYRELLQGVGDWDVLLVALVSSFVFGLGAIGGLLHIVRRFSYFSFALYRVLLAMVLWIGFI